MSAFDEHPHNTPSQVETYLREALRLVAALDPPADLRPLCFDKAVQLISAKTLVQAPPALVAGRLGVGGIRGH